ncbi:coiled-coil domain-containing protein [Brachionus plicatilis]|uniref:Dynein regulatory complex protein 12 n=1 Tax=Brachionus plicatilis TaxID=10195 RepID=A0A3M7SDI7_BRAPC|nr:coiled-coil domain-containing protein [Brachionus plicatilis]
MAVDSVNPKLQFGTIFIQFGLEPQTKQHPQFNGCLENKGKKGKKKGKDGELNEEDKLKLKTHEVETLKDNLAFRKDLSRKTRAVYEELKEKLVETNNQIEEIENVHKASSAYLTHQYKTMQNEMNNKIHLLETELIATRKQLEKTESLLQQEIQDKKRITMEKDDRIMDLEQRLVNFQTGYDNILKSTFDDFSKRLNEKKFSWENKSAQLQTKNKLLLAELGLKIHDI